MACASPPIASSMHMKATMVLPLPTSPSRSLPIGSLLDMSFSIEVIAPVCAGVGVNGKDETKALMSSLEVLTG